MRAEFRSRRILFLVPFIATAIASASEPSSIPPVFEEPQPISYGAPDYPSSEVHDGREGWVYLNYMIDAQGRPFEPAVIESSGTEAFEIAAMEVVKRWIYEPAKVGGQPSVSRDMTKFTFKMNPSNGAGYSFVKRYQALMKAIKAGDRPAADAQLAILDVRNLYEDAFVGLANYQYHKKWGGTEAQQLADLQRALAREKSIKYLSKVNFIFVLKEMVPLQIKEQDLMGAYRSWAQLRKVDPAEAGKFQGEIDRILALRSSDQSYRMPGQLERASWQVELLKTRFEVSVSTGRISDIKLRCDRHFEAFTYQAGLQYNTDSRHGDCWVELIGEPGTAFELIQM